MSFSHRIPLGALASATAAATLSALVGCSEASPPPDCPGLGAPTVLELSDLTPALDASVVNDTLVHSFTIVGDVSFDSLALSYPTAHTAGTPEPALTFSHVPATALLDFVSVPVTWTTAPAHVEITTPVVYQTPDGCAYQLPTPLFSYDVTAP